MLIIRNYHMYSYVPTYSIPIKLCYVSLLICQNIIFLNTKIPIMSQFSLVFDAKKKSGQFPLGVTPDLAAGQDRASQAIPPPQNKQKELFRTPFRNSYIGPTFCGKTKVHWFFALFVAALKRRRRVVVVVNNNGQILTLRSK